MNDLETKRRWKNSTLRISSCWSELREVLSLWLFHANCLSLVLVIPFWSRLFLKLTLTFLISIGQFPFQSHTKTGKYKRKLNHLFLFLSFFPFLHTVLREFAQHYKVFFFLHFKFLSWHSSCPFQVSPHSWLITHHSSLMAHHSWLITHGSSLITHHSCLPLMTPGFHQDSWLPSWLLAPLLTPGSPLDSWLPSWLLAIVFLIVIYGELCSFIFYYWEKPRGNSDRPFFTFWQKTWGTPDRPFFTFWQKTSRNFDLPFYISLNKVKLFAMNNSCLLILETLRDLFIKTLYTEALNF